MKPLLAPVILCTTLACQAAEDTAVADAASPASAPSKVSRGRCQTLPRLNLAKMPSGDVRFVARFLIKADGSVENVRVESARVREIRRLVLDGFNGYRCLPGDADEESTLEFKMGSGFH